MNINNITTNKSVFKNFYSENNNQNIPLTQKLQSKKPEKKFNKQVIATTIAGLLIPMLVIRKYQSKGIKLDTLKKLDSKSKIKAILKSFNLQYGLKEMLFTSFGSILGGFVGGTIGNTNENKKAKIKESVFQLNNIAIPTTLVAALLNFSDKSKNPKAIFLKIASVAIGIGIGMPFAAAASDKINNTIVDKDNKNKRKLKLKDCFVHIDDLLGALVLAKIPFADKLHIDKALPILYGICGYEAGIKK